MRCAPPWPTVNGEMTVRVERIAWRRLNVPHHYVGALSVGDGRLRLSGRDPGTGIEVSLVIPFAEISRVRVSASPAESLRGGPAVVLDLAGSRAICVRELGAASPSRLARRLAALIPGRLPSERAAAAR